MKKIKVLDCTCRDGGYYNLWNFKIDEINQYLSSCSKAGINIVEIGFVFPAGNEYGPFAYSQKKLFSKLQIPKNLNICVMINAKDFYEKKHGHQIKKMFLNSKLSPFKMVRIAINFNEFDFGRQISKDLKQLGYKVGFNLMQSHNKKINQIANIGKEITKWKSVDYLYFADSIGCMDPKYINYFCKTLKKYWKKDIGIHAHNNKSFALINTLEAIDAGATMVDSTMLGMGRGAGNTCTENLLIELKKRKFNYKPKYLANTLPYFQLLKNKYNWGPNYYYHFSAANNIHPTYIQKILSSNKYSNDFITKIIENLTQQKSDIFKEDYLNNQIYKIKDSEGNFEAQNYLKGKKVLIIGSGDSGNKELKKVEEFIKKYKPTVISLNINPYIKNKYIDFYLSCFDFRVFFELSEILKKNKPIIIPLNRFKNNLKFDLKKEKIIDYGLVVKENSFKSYSNHCEIDKPLALTYALAFCKIANPIKISLAFIDGYKDDIKENKYLFKIISKFQKQMSNKINFLTKSMLN